MTKKVIGCIIALAILFCFLCSCDTENGADIVSSGISGNEQMVVGSANEGGYPDFDSSISFSDVSIPLTSETTSQDKSSSSKNNSDKSSNATTTTTSTPSTQNTTTNTSPTNTSKEESNLNSTRLNYDTTKAVWISYIDFYETLSGKTETQFRNSFKTICENCTDFGLNTIICQVRAFSDAFYPSEYFSWSKYIAGIGKDPGYDPLEIMIEIAHDYDISFHAWINPFRACLDSEVSKIPSESMFKKWYNDSTKNGTYIVKYNTRWYFNPGESEVRTLILNGVKEIINNYQVDGIHFDDYFYPTTDSSFDSASFKAYGNGKTLADWRRNNVSTLVKDVYDAIKSKNKDIVFGISPQGNINNNMNQQYADVKLWCANNGYVDYICPQIYYSYKSESLSFSTALSQWNSLVTASGVDLMVGLAPYRIGGLDEWACSNKTTHTEQTANCGKYAWQTQTPSSSNILAKQCADSLSLGKCAGVFLYTYQSVFNIDNYFAASGYADNAVEQAKAEMSKLKDALK